MFGRVLIVISCFIFVFALSAEANDFDKCRVGANSSMEVQLNTLQKSPYLKKGEFLRTRLYSKGIRPWITIISSKQSITFGRLKNDSSFALYKGLEDYYAARNPCDSEFIHVK
uniref:Uncharacterized protein n=1 Tax=Megaselia scalaris TaxID=36166 RepID=T1GNH8_MEGSC